MRLTSVARCLLFVLSIALSQSVGHADYVAGLDPYGDNFLALRAGPGTSFRTIRRMGPDTILTVLRRRGAWLRVRTEDVRCDIRLFQCSFVDIDCRAHER